GKDWITASGEWDPRLTLEVKQLDPDPASSRVRVQGGELGDPDDCFAVGVTLRRPRERDDAIRDALQTKLNALVSGHGRVFNDRYDPGSASPPNTPDDVVMWYRRTRD